MHIWLAQSIQREEIEAHQICKACVLEGHNYVYMLSVEEPPFFIYYSQVTLRWLGDERERASTGGVQGGYTTTISTTGRAREEMSLLSRGGGVRNDR